ncbi:MAG: hypothetical protein WD176_02360, partial [Pirellulales bacterium]
MPLSDRLMVNAWTTLGTASAGQAVPSAGPTSVLPARNRQFNRAAPAHAQGRHRSPVDFVS